MIWVVLMIIITFNIIKLNEYIFFSLKVKVKFFENEFKSHFSSILTNQFFVWKLYLKI